MYTQTQVAISKTNKKDDQDDDTDHKINGQLPYSGDCIRTHDTLHLNPTHPLMSIVRNSLVTMMKTWGAGRDGKLSNDKPGC
jgi:hypothetical protein